MVRGIKVISPTKKGQKKGRCRSKKSLGPARRVEPAPFSLRVVTSTTRRDFYDTSGDTWIYRFGSQTPHSWTSLGRPSHSN